MPILSSHHFPRLQVRPDRGSRFRETSNRRSEVMERVPRRKWFLPMKERATFGHATRDYFSTSDNPMGRTVNNPLGYRGALHLVVIDIRLLKTVNGQQVGNSESKDKCACITNPRKLNYPSISSYVTKRKRRSNSGGLARELIHKQHIQ